MHCNQLLDEISCAGRLSDDILALTFDDTVQQKYVTWSTRDVHIRQLVRVVSHLLRTVTRVVHVQADIATLHDDAASAPLLLKLDITKCVDRCFTSARSAAMFIAMHRTRQLGALNLTSIAGAFCCYVITKGRWYLNGKPSLAGLLLPTGLFRCLGNFHSELLRIDTDSQTADTSLRASYTWH